MEKSTLLVVAMVAMSTFATATEHEDKTNSSTQIKREAIIKEKETDKQKEEFFIRLLVTSTNKCEPWPLCG